MVMPPSAEALWAVSVEEEAKVDGIFESLLPMNGLLFRDKLKPVLMNSKLPPDVLGWIWDLSNIDQHGHLDRDEFAVAMHFVYQAVEKEPVPSALAPSLIPPSKRNKTVPWRRPRPVCQPPTKRQPALHTIPRPHQQPQQHGEPVPKHSLKQT
ncbi:Epidermal growth factor receptor substrate 15-like 1 [Plecturocebus cupreus]